MWTDGIEEKVNWVKFGEGTWFRFFKFKASALETYFGSFSQNTGNLPYEPAIWLLGIYPKEINIYVHHLPVSFEIKTISYIGCASVQETQ